MTLETDITTTDGAVTVAFKGELITGVTNATYEVPALKAGSYPFQCTVHPSMTGTITAK